jgi:predicted phosphodiesterase
MTRFIIFADLHANWEALLALQQAEPQPDVILYLGDIVGYGPDPKLCLDSVRANTSYLIGGYHDFAVNADHSSSRYDGLQAESLTHTHSVLAAEDRDYLASLPVDLTVDLSGTRFHLTRLKPDDVNVETHVLITMSQAQLRERFGAIDADIILLGGPHIPTMRQFDDCLIVCPGSLGQPRYGVPDPTYAAWEDGQLQIHHLHYQPEPTIRKTSLLPLDPDHVLQLQSILRTGGLD